MGEAFTAGIRPGGLTDENGVRILTLHILASAQGPLTFDQLTEVVLSDQTANYFEFAKAVAALAEVGCTASFRGSAGELYYTLTDKGREAAATLVRELPASIRERSARFVSELLRRERIEKENTVSIDRVEGGYTVRMRVTDIGEDLMELKLFMPTFEQAQEVKARFHADPAKAYRDVLTALADIT